MPHASSAQPGAAAAYALDGALSTAWKSDPAAGAEQTLTLDFQQPREFGGVVLHWLDTCLPLVMTWSSPTTATTGEPCVRWLTAMAVVIPSIFRSRRRVSSALCCTTVQRAPMASPRSTSKTSPLAPHPTPFSRPSRAKRHEGYFPRGFSGEQSYWTVVGVDGGAEEGLLSEDGALEVGKAGFSIEPFVLTESELLTWADVQAATRLAGSVSADPHRRLAA